MEKRETLKVRLFGRFEIQHGEGAEARVLTERDSTSKLLWTFLEYLVVFHKRGVTQEELIEALWGDLGGSSNPTNTLKTLLHRSRLALERLGLPDGKQALHYRRGLYTWSPDVHLELDMERFDQLCEQAGTDQLEPVFQAIQLYQGDFLPNAMGSPWAVSLRTYYHAKFLKACRETASYLLQLGRSEEAAHLCQHATVIDPYEEACHLLLIQALIAVGEQQAAIQHYTHVTKLFMDQLGVSPSAEMTALYRKLVKAGAEVEMNLDVVREQLQELHPDRGAFFCEYGVFQNIYRLEARNAVRSGRGVQLAMLTVLDQNGNRLESKRCSAAMKQLQNIIQTHLRAGDAFTRFSAPQFLILLPAATYENGITVLQRILDAYEETVVGKSVHVEYSLLPVLPVQEMEPLPTGFVSIKQRAPEKNCPCGG